MFERLRQRYVGRKNWLSITASVFSAEFHNGSRNQPNGYYSVSYTFWIDGHIYEGEFSEPAPSNLKKDDPIEVLYCPSDANINFNPDFDFIYQHGLPTLFAMVGVIFAIATAVFVLNR